MSIDDFNEDAPREEPAKQGMSTTAKVLLTLGVLAGVGLLACCGVCGFFGYSFQPTVSEQAAEVRAVQHEIASMQIPETFEPEMSMKVDNFMMAMRLANFKHVEGKGQMVLMEFAMKMGAAQPGQEQQFRQAFEQQQGQPTKRLNIKESETRDLTINGEQVPVTFAQGDDPSSDTEYRQVRTTFQGNNGPAILELQVEEEVWNEQAVLKMLESIGK